MTDDQVKNAVKAAIRRKLELLTAHTGHYRYQLGLYINIDGGRLDCTWYNDGIRLR